MRDAEILRIANDYPTLGRLDYLQLEIEWAASAFEREEFRITHFELGYHIKRFEELERKLFPYREDE